VTEPLLKYPDDIQIDFSANLKCGACIRGGYIYCVNGFEEDLDLYTKPATCCRDVNNCPQNFMSSWMCSNIYSNKVQAMNICPYSVDNCGPAKNITFDTWDVHANISVSLAPGDTCNYFVTTECGVPAYQPENVKGFEIYSIDYTEDNLGADSAGYRRLLSDSEPEKSVDSNDLIEDAA
jgi:hypothetical protein